MEWDLIGKGQLSDQPTVLVIWSPKGSPGSEAGLDQTTYVLTKNGPSVEATVQTQPQCTGKMT